MGRERDDFERYHKPFLGRVLDDIVGGVIRAVSWAFRGFAWIVFQIVLGAPLRLFGRWRTGVAESKADATLLNLTLGFPAVVMALALGTLAVLVWRTPAGNISGRYRAAAREAREAGDFDAAILYFERNRIKESGNPEHAYELALLQEAKGDRERARLLMEQIVGTSDPENPTAPVLHAHIWLAGHLLSMRPTPTQVEAARVHINRVLAKVPDSPHANMHMARLNELTGRISEAERCLQVASQNSPEARLQLAQLLYRFPPRRAEALREARTAETSFRNRLQADRADHQARNSLMMALVIAGDADGALRLAEEGEALFPKEGYTEKRARIELQAALQAPAGDADGRWRRLARAFDLGFKTPEILGPMLKLALADPADEQALRTMLDRHRQGDNDKAAAADLLLGLLAVHRGKPGEAQVLILRADKLVPNVPKQARQTIESALLTPGTAVDLASALVRAWPQDYEMQQYRAGWRFLAGNAQEALVELEALLPHRQHDPTYFLILSEVCRRVGLVDKAEEYRVRWAATSQARQMEAAEAAQKAKAADKGKKQ